MYALARAGSAIAASAWLLLCTAMPGQAAAFSLQADPFVQQGEKLVGSEVSGMAEQGSSVAISADGNTALIGGPADNSFAGAAWVYVRSGSTWTQQAKLVGKDASALAQQGFSVALSADGNTALIGGPEDEGTGTFPGAAWVFTRSGSTWTEQTKLVGTGASTPSGQGHSVALSADGDTALVGSYLDEKGKGAAWVFTRTGSTWSQQGGKLVGAAASALDEQGWSVALAGDGDTALVGGPKTENEIGAAWMFTRTGSTWSEDQELPAGTGAIGQAAEGESVALSADGSTALVGGTGDDKALGATWVYTRSGSTWTQQGEKLLGDDASTEPQQGHSTALSEDGDTALVGGYHDDTSVGAAWAFVRSGSTWTEQQKLVGTGSQGGFPTQGTGVALSGDGATALVGGAGDNGEVGATWVFARTPASEPEPEKEPESKEPGSKGPSSTGSTGTGGTSSNSSGSTLGSSVGVVLGSTGIATTPQAIEELRLGCSKRPLVLNDVLVRGARVALEGSAAKSLVGKQVKILFDAGKQVATATVAADGQFATTAPLPPARLRDSNKARYMAVSGSQRSLDLKLTRRLELEPPSLSAGTVTLVGQVVAPLAKPIASVAVQEQLQCGKTAVVKRFTPPASGRFWMSIAVPAAAKAALYRLSSAVAVKPGSKHAFATYSLPLPAILG